MSNQNRPSNIVSYSKYALECNIAYNRSMIGLTNIAQDYLRDFFFPEVLKRTAGATGCPITLNRSHINDYVKECIGKSDYRVTISWPLEDFTTQVMLFIIAELKGVEYLYRNDSFVMQNPLCDKDHPDHGGYHVTVKGEDKVNQIIVDLSINILSGLYDPLAQESDDGGGQSLPESLLD